MPQTATKIETYGNSLLDIVDLAFGPLEAHIQLWGAAVNMPGAGQDELNAWVVTRALVDQARQAITQAVDFAASNLGQVHFDRACANQLGTQCGEYLGVSIAD